MPRRRDLIALSCHPLTPTEAVDAIQVRFDLAPRGSLTLDFRLWGDPRRLRIPKPQPSGHVDGLWAHTCFEAFAAVAGDAAYREFNFSPSGQWASYVFRDYRARTATATLLPPLQVTPRRTPDGVELEARIPPRALAPSGGARLQIGLSAVVEDRDGTLSYWALRHPAGRPDFHHRHTFAVELV